MTKDEMMLQVLPALINNAHIHPSNMWDVIRLAYDWVDAIEYIKQEREAKE
jgi:type II secretory pathway component PulK